MLRRLSFVIAAAALVLGACGSSGPTPTPVPELADPREILARTVLALKDVKSLHLRADVTGEITLDLLGTGSSSPLDLKGTTLEGDVDLAGRKLHLSFAAPAIISITGEVIVIDQATYLKVVGSKYLKTTSTTSPTDPQQWVADLGDFLAKPDTAPTRLADEKCGDLDCYVVRLPLTSDQLESVIPPGLESAAPRGTGKIDIWVRKGDVRPSKLAVTADAGTAGTVAVAVVFSAYDVPVTINAPPDSEVDAR